MAIIRFFSNPRLLRNPNSAQFTAARIRNLSFDQCNGNSEELTRQPHIRDENFAHNLMENPQNQFFRVHDVAREVSRFIKTRPGWEQTLLNEFPSLDFSDPVVYNAVLKEQSNVILSVRFYSWIKSFIGSKVDPDLSNTILCRLVDSNSANAAKTSRFEVEPRDLESCIRCLCENGLIDESLFLLQRFKNISHSMSLDMWNSALSHSVRTNRVDAVWILYGYMTECGVPMDINALGHLIQAFCLENNAAKGYELLQQVLASGHVPDKAVFNSLISKLGRNRNFDKISSVVHSMIAKNCMPDIYTYKEIVFSLCNGGREDEGLQIFNELKDRGYSLDISMYKAVINALFRIKNLDGARKLWNEMIESGMAPNKYAYNVFIKGLFKNGSVDEATELYKTLLSKGFGYTTIILNTMISGLCSNGKVEEARLIFETMNGKGIDLSFFTYNSMVEGYLRKGDIDEGMRLLIKHGFMPTITCFTMLIKKLCGAGRVKEAEMLWLDMKDRGLDICSPDPIACRLIKQGRFVEKADCVKLSSFCFLTMFRH